MRKWKSGASFVVLFLFVKQVSKTHRAVFVMDPAKIRQMQKDMFFEYLDDSGAMGALIDSLSSLYEEPEMPQDLKKYLFKKITEHQNEILRLKIRYLEKELQEIKQKVEECEKGDTPTQDDHDSSS